MARPIARELEGEPTGETAANVPANQQFLGGLKPRRCLAVSWVEAPAASRRPASACETREGERRLDTPHALDGAHRRRGQRPDGVRETRRVLERPTRQAAVQEPGDERIAGSRAVDSGHRERLDRSLELVRGDEAARSAALEHDRPDAPLAEPRGDRRGLLLPRDRTSLGQARSEQVDVRQRRKHALPSSRRVPDRVEARQEPT